MFEKTEAAEFQSITAPAELRDRVLDATQKAEKFQLATRRKNIRTISVMAACLLLTVAIFTYPFLGINSGKITVNGERLTASCITLDLNTPLAASANPRSADTVSIKMTIASQNPSDIMVTHGKLLLMDADSGNIVAEGQNLSALGDVELIWEVELSDTSAEPRLTFIKKGRTNTVTLKYDAAEELWKAFRS
ncbi:MAG: hypothetical protein IJO96_01145 [Oscillospiraceae bacterium]|nr:hypothetical protein [Oscillospiraceae bacterium]